MIQFDEVYRRSLEMPEEFWAEAAAAIDWVEPWERVLDDSRAPFYRWFRGGRLNTCYNALDRHVERGTGRPACADLRLAGHGDDATFTYRELRDAVASFAGRLAAQGVERGDRVIVYMPMVPEAVDRDARVRAASERSTPSSSAASRRTSSRAGSSDAQAQGRRRGLVRDRAGRESSPTSRSSTPRSTMGESKPERCIVLQRPMLEAELDPGRDIDWDDAVAAAEPADCVAVEATDPLYILYTSGTTGQPKGIVRDNGGHAVALAWSMKQHLRRRAGRGVLGGVGRRLGRRPLVHRLRAALPRLHDGAVRGEAGRHTRCRRVLARDRRARRLHALHRADRLPRHPPAGSRGRAHRALRPLAASARSSSPGERCDPETLRWAEQKLGVPVIDHWWQTETGWAIVANCLGIERLPVEPGSPTRAVPGLGSPRAGRRRRRACRAARPARSSVKLPMPPGASPTLWNADERFREAYLVRSRATTRPPTPATSTSDGYVFVMARTDDIINVAGHRLSTGAMEEVLAAHPDVAECAVIGVADELKGQVPVGFARPEGGRRARRRARSWRRPCSSSASGSGPVASFKTAVVVERLPKTRSGKILRGTMRRIADGEEYLDPGDDRRSGDPRRDPACPGRDRLRTDATLDSAQSLRTRRQCDWMFALQVAVSRDLWGRRSPRALRHRPSAPPRSRSRRRAWRARRSEASPPVSGDRRPATPAPAQAPEGQGCAR